VKEAENKAKEEAKKQSAETATVEASPAVEAEAQELENK